MNPDSDLENVNAVSYYRYLNKLLIHCTDPIRLRIIMLLFVHPRLTRSQFSTYLNRSKPAVTYQLNQLKELELLQVSEEVGDQGHKVKYYHFGAEIRDRTNFIPRHMVNVDEIDPKEFQTLEARSIGLLFQFTRILMQLTSNFYEEYEEKINETKQRFEIPSPFFEYSINNLTKEEWKYYQSRINALNSEMDERIVNNMKNKSEPRPYLSCNLTVPLQEVLESEKNQL